MHVHFGSLSLYGKVGGGWGASGHEALKFPSRNLLVHFRGDISPFDSMMSIRRVFTKVMEVGKFWEMVCNGFSRSGVVGLGEHIRDWEEFR